MTWYKKSVLEKQSFSELKMGRVSQIFKKQHGIAWILNISSSVDNNIIKRIWRNLYLQGTNPKISIGFH